MENTNEKTISLLNGLIEINNDRIEGYERASKETDDSELKSLFHKMAEDSRQYRGELITEVVSSGGSPAEGTTTSGKFYRAWMDLKAAITGKDAHAIIASCEFGEDAALDAYDDVIKDGGLNTKSSGIVSAQQRKIKQSHDHIKTLRDTVKEEK